MYISDVVKNISIIIISFLLANCTGYTVTSLSTNVVSYTTTGKTNTDHVISFVTGKDCKIFRATRSKDICNQNNNVIALNEGIKDFKNVEETKIVKKTIKTVYNLTKNLAKDHAVLGAKIIDKIGLTNDLEKKVYSKFDSINGLEKQTKLIKDDFKKEIVKRNSVDGLEKQTKLIKDDFKKEIVKRKEPWNKRVQEAQKKREKFKQNFLKTLKKIKLPNVDGYALNNIK